MKTVKRKTNLRSVIKDSNEPLDDDAKVRDIPEKSGLDGTRM